MRSSLQRPAFTTDSMEYALCSTSIATACRRGGPRESDHQDASSGCVWGPRLGIGAEQEERGEYRYCIPHPFFLWCSVLTLETPSDGRTQMFTTCFKDSTAQPHSAPATQNLSRLTTHNSQLTTHPRLEAARHLANLAVLLSPSSSNDRRRSMAPFPQ